CFSDMEEREIEKYLKIFKKVISKAAKDFKPDVIHTNHLWLASAAAREVCPDIPMVTSCHGTELRQLENCPHLREHVVGPCRKIDCIIALSKIQKKEIINKYGIKEDKIIPAGSGFNHKLFSYAKNPAPPPVNLLYAGKLSKAKGVDWFIKSLSVLKNITNIPFHLYIAGSGTGKDYKECKDLALEMKDSITLCGALSHNELSELMKKSHIFVLPSFFEGLPLVLFEALASGCRVISTDLPGAKEIAGNADSDFIKFINLPDLKSVDTPFESDMPYLIKILAEVLNEELENVLSQPSVDKSESEKIINAYTWKEVFKRIDNVYISVLKEKESESGIQSFA
ncbi:MAG: glycosyltransferase, partial [Thermodesulfobacteriota bacterium]